MSPPSNSFLFSKEIKQQSFPLRVLVCEDCWLVQTEDFHSPEDLFDQNYPYLSGYSSTWQHHCKVFAERMVQEFSLNNNSKVIEVASNDGTLLDYFKQTGVDCLGVEPTPAANEIARQRGLKVVENFLDQELSEKIVEEFGKASLVVANNVLAHVPDINDFVGACSNLLARNGIASFEFQYLPRLIENHLFDTIYHEHFSYLSFHSARNILMGAGLEIFASEEIPTHGGSLRVFSRLASTRESENISLTEEIIEYEKSIGVASSVFYKDFQKAADNCRDLFLDFLRTKRDKKIVAYGAAAKGNTFLNFVGASQESIDYVVDRNVEKIGKHLPGSLLPVMPEARLKEDQPDYVLILPWNIADELVLQLDYVKQWGGTLFTAVPTLRFYE
tara:strand:+ start:544 stop:1707 length:1164 start_codon:yes stop_codon:yes gene_type:complete